MRITGRVQHSGEFNHTIRAMDSDSAVIAVDHSHDHEFWLRLRVSREDLVALLAAMDEAKAFDEEVADAITDLFPTTEGV